MDRTTAVALTASPAARSRCRRRSTRTSASRSGRSSGARVVPDRHRRARRGRRRWPRAASAGRRRPRPVLVLVPAAACSARSTSATSLVTVRTLGAGGVTAATIAGQLTMSVVVDHVRAARGREAPITAAKLAGIVLLAVAACSSSSATERYEACASAACSPAPRPRPPRARTRAARWRGSGRRSSRRKRGRSIALTTAPQGGRGRCGTRAPARAAANRRRCGAPRGRPGSGPAPARASGGPRRPSAARARRRGRSRARCGCPRPSCGRQWPAESPAKKTPSSAAVAHLVGDPVALVAVGGGTARSPGEPDRRLPDVVARLERADADAQLAPGGERPAVAGVARTPSRSIHTSRSEPPAARVDLQAARQPRLGGLDRLVAPRSRRQPSASTTSAACEVAAVGVDGRAAACARRPSPSRSATSPWAAQQRAQLAVVESRERPWQPPAASRLRRVDDERRRTSGGPSPRGAGSPEPLRGAAHADVCRSPTS